MDSISRLGMAAVDAVGRKPKAGWRDTLILACDDVEDDFDTMVKALENLIPYLEAQASQADEVFAILDAREALAKVKRGE